MEYSKNYYQRYKKFDNSRLNVFIIENLKRLFKTKSSPRVNVTIDIGCGIGKLIYKLNDYSKIAIGLDISSNALEIAKKYKGPFFILGDSLKIPIKDNVCDICLCIHVIEHIEEFDVLLKEIYRIMLFNGKIIFLTPNKKWTRFALPFLKDRTHVKEFTISKLKKLISDYFCIKDIKSFSMFTSFGIFNPILNTLVKPDICISAIKNEDIIFKSILRKRVL